MIYSVDVVTAELDCTKRRLGSRGLLKSEVSWSRPVSSYTWWIPIKEMMLIRSRSCDFSAGPKHSLNLSPRPIDVNEA